MTKRTKKTNANPRIRAELLEMAHDGLIEPKTGRALVACLQASPHRRIEIEPDRIPMPASDAEPLSPPTIVSRDRD